MSTAQGSKKIWLVQKAGHMLQILGHRNLVSKNACEIRHSVLSTGTVTT